MQTLNAAIREFVQAIVNPYDLEDLLERLTRHATDVFDATGAGIHVYRSEPTAWSDEDVEACEILAAMGAGYVLHANQLVASHRLNEQLQEALDTRAERAKGLLMARHEVDADTAFALLRQTSMDSNRKLR